MVVYAYKVAGTTSNQIQYYPTRIVKYFGIYCRPYHRLPLVLSCTNANVTKRRCYRFVTLSILSVACVSAWTTRQDVTTRTPCTTKLLQPYKSKSHDIDVWRFIYGAFHSTPFMTRCHTLEYEIDPHSSTAIQSELIYNGEKYELMPIPDRGKVSTHAIHGTLFKESCIERYDVYRRRRRPRDDDGAVTARVDNTKEIRSDCNNHADVVAIVTFGSDLDGHKNIVHGGIIALIIDDVLGFGYFAILLQEYECRLETNSRSNNGTLEESFDPDVVAVTANLNINYRAPVPTNSAVVVEATLVRNDETGESRRERNKFYWNVKVTSLDPTTTYCQATSLYVVPKRQII